MSQLRRIMPKTAERQKALKDIKTLQELHILDISNSEDDATGDINDLLLLRGLIESTRYFISSSSITKDSDIITLAVQTLLFANCANR